MRTKRPLRLQWPQSLVFLTMLITVMTLAIRPSGAAVEASRSEKPNVILCMTDDQGWGDTGYNGHPFLKTPHLDAMAAEGIRFNRFYAGAPVCSPTRGSCLTGRHPYRYGITFANTGHILNEEVTLAEILRSHGYTTGHFGKWHLGTLTTTMRDSNRGRPGDSKHFAPPAQHGFDVNFSTEAKVPTWDPMRTPGADKPYGTHYFNTDGSVETEDLTGDDSRVIMDRALPFVRDAVEREKPFFAVIWFHSPHLPCVAGPKYRAMYEAIEGADPDYHGCITAMDDQMGRLRGELRRLGVEENTMLWFCSDNGPEGRAGKAPGSAGKLRGRKRDLFEGGVRVPGLLVWPARIGAARTVDIPCSTLDYYPTVLDALGIQVEDQPEPVDGVSLLGLIDGGMAQRPVPIGFQSGNQVALVGNRYKLIRGGKKGPAKRATGADSSGYMLFDLMEDPGETCDLAADQPEIAEAMGRALERWQRSCQRSANGVDYIQDGTH